MSAPSPISRSRFAGNLRFIEIDVDPSVLPRRSRSWKHAVSAVSISFFLHAVLLTILGMLVFSLPERFLLDSILSLTIGKEEPLGDGLEVDQSGMNAPSDDASPSADEFIAPFEADLSLSSSLVEESDEPRLRHVDQTSVTPAQPSATATKSTATTRPVPTKGAKTSEEGKHEDHFTGRTVAGKAALIKRMGGTDASEAAVARGLVWLKNHQLPNGSWNFDHNLASPQCDCTMPGRLSNNPNGGTAMALMAFLGAGQTHLDGQYQSEVRLGLDFLKSNGTPTPKGICYYGNLTGPPTFYTQGLVTIALSEAFAMTHDINLRPSVTGAIDFLAATQHQGGGWRYFPGQPGDTSVVAWDLMALKSAQFSRIAVPPRVFQGVDRFLGSVGSVRGSRYAYTPERKNTPTPSMTAAGLLCRMYLDWSETSPGLRAGVLFLDEHGPDRFDMYFNYYATQVMHHWGGEEWDRWNNVMRDHLIQTQLRQGHATGSWDVADRHGNMGGRLYMTTLALLTLEVYYRHLPLYQRDRIEMPLLEKK
ncbi:MAG: prenyltransferase/squalene oxidase repeat-containing protein [Planctomycetaceae bacterium]